MFPWGAPGRPPHQSRAAWVAALLAAARRPGRACRAPQGIRQAPGRQGTQPQAAGSAASGLLQGTPAHTGAARRGTAGTAVAARLGQRLTVIFMFTALCWQTLSAWHTTLQPGYLPGLAV